MTTNPSGFYPLDVRLVVLPAKVEEKTAGGVYIPEIAQQKQQAAAVRATVMAVGENVGIEWGSAARKPAPGDLIVMAQYSGASIKGEDGEKYTVLNDKDVLAIVEVAQ